MGRAAVHDASKFVAETTAGEAAEGIDLGGKLAIVTGASSGIGQETARVLAARGAQVILTARDLPKGEAVAEGIRRSTGSPRVEVEELAALKVKSVEAGAATSLFAATAPELEGRGCLYLEDCQIAAVKDAADAVDGVRRSWWASPFR